LQVFIAVHDMFNWLTVLIILPIDAATGYLYYLTETMVSGLRSVQDTRNPQFLKVITDPLTQLIIEVRILPLFASRGTILQCLHVLMR